MKNYIDKIKETHLSFTTKDQILYYLIGLSGEVGELQELFKKRIFRGDLISDKDIKLEIGDILCYLMLLIDILDFDLNEIQELNIKKLKDRGLIS